MALNDIEWHGIWHAGKRQRQRPNADRTPQASPYERVDKEERAYQKLEKAYTAKTELEAATKGGTEGSGSKGKRSAEGKVGSEGEGVDGARKKGKAGLGRWFD